MPTLTDARNGDPLQLQLNVGCLICAIFVPVALWIALWVVSARFEAEAFNRLTGRAHTPRRATTWDAMFLDLKIVDTIERD